MDNKEEYFKDVSLLPFTEEELKEMNLTPEELDILEYASAYSQTVDMLPDDITELTDKIEETFKTDENANLSPEEEFNSKIQQLSKLCDTDPEFVNQMIALQEVFAAMRPDTQEEENDSSTEK